MTARRLWAWLPWIRRRGTRRAALAAAEAANRAAQRAARQRLIDAAHDNTGPAWSPFTDPMWRTHRNRR